MQSESLKVTEQCRIIEPITSRCSKFRFKSLDSSNTFSCLQTISKAENVSIEDPALEALVKVSDGDLRRAITFLQSASKLQSGLPAGSKDATITARSIQEISGVVPTNVMNDFGRAMGLDITDAIEDGDVEMEDSKAVAKGKAPARGGYETVRKAVERIVRDGYSAVQVISQVSFFYSPVCTVSLMLL